MNSLSPSQPLVLVMIGTPGSGKSFFARRFAETFNAPLISFDEIRFELFNDITHSEDEDFVVARVAGMQLRELLRTKKTIVIDGGHNPKVNRAELAKIVKRAGYDVLNVWVQADERTARSRSLRRKEDVDDDRFNRPLSDEEFYAHARTFTPPSKYESYVVISGRHTYPAQARTVLKKLVTSHDTKSPEPPKRPESGGAPRRTLHIQ